MPVRERQLIPCPFPKQLLLKVNLLAIAACVAIRVWSMARLIAGFATRGVLVCVCWASKAFTAFGGRRLIWRLPSCGGLSELDERLPGEQLKRSKPVLLIDACTTLVRRGFNRGRPMETGVTRPHGDPCGCGGVLTAARAGFLHYLVLARSFDPRRMCRPASGD